MVWWYLLTGFLEHLKDWPRLVSQVWGLASLNRFFQERLCSGVGCQALSNHTCCLSSVGQREKMKLRCLVVERLNRLSLGWLIQSIVCYSPGLQFLPDHLLLDGNSLFAMGLSIVCKECPAPRATILVFSSLTLVSSQSFHSFPSHMVFLEAFFK